MGCAFGTLTACWLAVLLALTPLLTQAQTEPDYLAYVLNEGTDGLTLVDPVTRSVIETIPALSWARQVVVTPDGMRAFLLAWRHIYVLDTASRTLVGEIGLRGEDPPSERMVMSPTGTFAYVMGSDEFPGSLTVIDTVRNSIDGSVRLPRISYDDYITGAAFSPDGEWAYVAANLEDDNGEHRDAIFVIDTAARSVVEMIDLGAPVGSLIVSPDGGTAYVTGASLLRALDLERKSVIASLELSGWTGVVGLSKEGQFAYVGHRDYLPNSEPADFISVIDTTSWQLLRTFPVRGRLRAVAADGGGDAVYLALGGPANVVAVIDTETQTITQEIATNGTPSSIVVAPAPEIPPVSVPSPRPISSLPAGSRYEAFVFNRTARTLAIIDPARAIPNETFRLPEIAFDSDMAVTSDGSTIYLANYDGILAFDGVTRNLLRAFSSREDYWFEHVAVSPNGRTIAATSGLGLTIFDTMDGASSDVLDRGLANVYGIEILRFSADGRRVVISSARSSYDDRSVGDLVVIDVASRRVEVNMELLRPAWDVVLSPDGTLAYASGGQAVTAVDLITKTIRAIVPVGIEAVGLAISADGTLLYLVGDGTLVTLDTASNRVLSRLALSSSQPLRTIAISPDGAVALITGGESVGQVTVVDLEQTRLRNVITVGEGADTIAFVPAISQTATPTPTRVPVPSSKATPEAPCAFIVHGLFDTKSPPVSILDPTIPALTGIVEMGQTWTTRYGSVVSDRATQVAVAPDGDVAYASVSSGNGGAGSLAIIDIAHAEVVDSILVGIRPTDVALSPDGTIAYVLNLGEYGSTGSISVVDLRERSVIAAVPTTAGSDTIALAPDGAALYLISDYEITAIDTGRLERLWSTDIRSQTPLFLASLSVSPDGVTLYATLDPSGYPDFPAVAVINAATGDTERMIWVPLEGNGLQSVLLPTAERLYVAVSGAAHPCDTTSCVLAIDTASGDLLAKVPISGYPSDMALTPAGDALYVTSWETGTVSVIDTTTYAVKDTVHVPDGPSAITIGQVRGTCGNSAAFTPLPSRTPTVTPTPSPTNVPPTPCEHDCVELLVGSAEGEPGEEIVIAVTLRAGNQAVAGVQTDLVLTPGLAFSSCRVNPDIEKDASAFAMSAPGCSRGVDCTGLRAIVVSFASTDAIADGSVLYTCKIMIDADTSAGRYTVEPTGIIAAADPEGSSLPIIATAGQIDVLGSRQIALDVAGDSRTGPSGCQTQPAGEPLGLMLLIPIVPLILHRRASVQGRARSHRSLTPQPVAPTRS